MDPVTKKKIEILLSNTLIKKSNKPYVRKAQAEDVTVLREESAKEVVVSNPDTWEVNIPQAVLLIKLYRQQPRKSQLDMVELLKSYVVDNSAGEIKSAAMIVLFNTGNGEVAITSITEGFTKYSQEQYLYSMLILSMILKYQPNIFSSPQVERIYDWTMDYFNGNTVAGAEARQYDDLYTDFTKIINSLYDKTNIIISNNFASQIETNFNPDINTDELKVRSYFEEIGFPVDLVESLDHINEQISNGDTPFKFKNTMDSIRAFTERLFEVVAKSIDPNTKIDGKDSGEAANFFRDQGLVSADMADVIRSLRHFISNNGVHRLKSRREDARIAKNIVLEVSLYLLTRLKEI